MKAIKQKSGIFGIMLTVIILCAASCTKHDDGNSNGTAIIGTYNGYDYVDLGLPSGTLWATCNVGASTPEDYGGYYAWGETTTKNVYSWLTTYKWCNSSSTSLTKYCNKSNFGYNGYTDNLTVLLPEDDAATANWGSGWCTPTGDDWYELKRNTTNTWTTRNGVNGLLLKAKNGGTLFLPAAGHRWEDGLIETDMGCYWSSTLGIESPRCAAHYYFNSTSFSGSYFGERNYGKSVRPVLRK